MKCSLLTPPVQPVYEMFSCSLLQFNQFMLVIKDMLQRVETDQQSHLDQLSKMEEQTK